MAGSTVLTAELLGIAGVTGALLAVLTGKTVREAVPIVEAIAAGKAASAVLRGDRVSYSVDGQTSTFSAAQMDGILAFLRKMAQDGGGHVQVPVIFR